MFARSNMQSDERTAEDQEPHLSPAAANGQLIDENRLQAFLHGYRQHMERHGMQDRTHAQLENRQRTQFLQHSQLLAQLDDESIAQAVSLGAFLVAYWLLDVYLKQPDKRSLIASPLRQALSVCSRTLTCTGGTLYI
jgi:hypothetical protein